MRLASTMAALALFAAAPSLSVPAHADPYKWCAVYGGFGNERSSCYYVTLAQCQQTVSGLGGWCRPSPYYDGKPVRTPEDYAYAPRKHRAKKQH